MKRYIFIIIATALYSSSIFTMNQVGPNMDSTEKATIAACIRVMLKEVNEENQELLFVKQFEALNLILGDGYHPDDRYLLPFQEKINSWARSSYPDAYNHLKNEHPYMAFYMVAKNGKDLFPQAFINQYAGLWIKYLVTEIKNSGQEYKKELLREFLSIE